jgi:predicted AlkP superfamily phosphohydrolase/phosphomutase
MSSRALVIGLDSAPLGLMVEWTEKGYLPNLARVFGRGSYGDLYSPVPVTPLAWSSIYTGLNPGRHGILGFMNHKPGTYEDFAVNSTLRDGRDLWEVAGSQGRKVVVVNTPLTYPPRPVNGSLVCGFMAPGTEGEFTYPASLGAELKRALPGYRIGTAPGYLKGPYLKELVRTVDLVGGAAVHLLEKNEWDLAFVVFKETDEVQHSFFDRPAAVLRLYREVDLYVGRLMSLAGESAYTFVVSDHGGEKFEKRFNVAGFLQRSGYVSTISARRSGTSRMLRGAARVMAAARFQWIFDVPGARKVMQGVIRARANAASDSDGFYAGKIDWPRTKAFISSGVGIRLNVKGREPQGVIEEEDYEKVRDELASQLSALRDPENGHTVFRHALPREKVLSGPHVADAPDIMCLPDTGYLPTEALASFDPLALTSSKGALFSRTSPWSGTHSPFGVVAVSGPGVERGRIRDAKLEDIAPTVLYAMGLRVPKGLDGKVLTEAFGKRHLDSNPVEWDEETARTEVAAKQLSKEEEQKIEERLKQLGYLA